MFFSLSTVSLLYGRIRIRIRNCHYAGSAPKRTLQETRQLVSFECGIVLSTQVLEWSLPLGTDSTNLLNRRLLLFYHFKPSWYYCHLEFTDVALDLTGAKATASNSSR